MGSVIGQVLRKHGVRVITCLQDRSERTKSLSSLAQIEDVPTYQDLVRESYLILSILVPSNAEQSARKVAQALQDTGTSPFYAECNAIAPQTTIEIEKIITSAGGRFIDACIIGPPPRNLKKDVTRFYASGPHVAALAELNEFGLDVRVMGDKIGQASGLKMCYAALNKGLSALSLELMTASVALGVSETLKSELELSQPVLYKRMNDNLPNVAPKSRRWVGEMEEIAKTFEQVGLTGKIFAGAADMYRFVGQTELADRNPEDPSPPPPLSQITAILSDHLIKTKNG
jgi:3-hydroxyisobutyrate dehydrogenase-like beta-hydroxyacid dehydrogenase